LLRAASKSQHEALVDVTVASSSSIFCSRVVSSFGAEPAARPRPGGVEREHRGGEVAGPRQLSYEPQHRLMAEMHAVERADRHRAPVRVVPGLGRIAVDPHEIVASVASTTEGLNARTASFVHGQEGARVVDDCEGPRSVSIAEQRGCRECRACITARARSASTRTHSRSRTASVGARTATFRAGLHRLDRTRVVQGEAADAQAAQRSEVRASTQRDAEVRCERPDVGSRWYTRP